MNININELSLTEQKEIAIKAANEFYLDEDHGVNMPDNVYDELLEAIARQDVNWSIYDYIGANGKTLDHKGEFPKGSKTKIVKIDELVYKLDSTTAGFIADNKVVFASANYVRGRLKEVLFYMNIEIPNQPYLIIKVPNFIFPNVITGLPNDIRDNTFRIAFLPTDIKMNGLRLTYGVTAIGLLPETDFNPNWADVRLGIIKTPQLGIIDLLSSEREEQYYTEFIKENEDYLASYSWFNTREISFQDKFTPKMDGCSIVAYYEGGRRMRIMSRSNDTTGKDKTAYFDPFFPRHISLKGNVKIMLEHVIDLRHGLGWNSRQKANGLTNSKYNQDQIALLSTFMIYDATDYKGNRLDINSIYRDIAEHQKLLYVELDNEPYRVLQNLIDVHGESYDQVANYLKSTIGWGSAENIIAIDVDSEFHDKLLGKVFSCRKYRGEKDYVKINNHSEGTYTLTEYGLRGSLPYLYGKINETEVIYLNKLSLTSKVKVVDYFHIFNYDEFIDPEHLAHYKHRDGGVYLVDGIVIHDTRDVKVTNKATGDQSVVTKPVHTIFKYSYNEIVKSKVTNIIWQESQYGSLIPVVQFETVQVEGSWLSRASVGGWNILKQRQIGVGSEVDIVRMNSTIPQILKVYNRIKPELPTCSHCGHQLTEETDMVNNVLRCCNDNCTGAHSRLEWFLKSENIVNQDDLESMSKALHAIVPISGYNKQQPLPSEESLNKLKTILSNDDFDGFVELLKNVVFVNMSPGNLNDFDYTIKSSYDILRTKLNYK